MTAVLRRTPCVGICSTTYGDLVCRGCKRFAHEIVQWNGFGEEQQRLVWERLNKLCEGAVLRHLFIEDEDRLRERAQQFKVPDRESLPLANVAYEVLRRSQNANDLTALGLKPRVHAASARELYQRVEHELFDRSVAQYERDFHIRAQ